MKNLLTTIILLFIFTSFSFAQYPRHGILHKYSNGLIYSDVTIQKLRKIADSLNYQFKQIKEVPSYISCPYTQAQYVKIDAKKVENRTEIFTDKMSFEDLIKKYSVLEVNRNAWIYKEDNTKNHHQADFNDYVSKSWRRYPSDKWALIETGNWAVHREGWTYMPFQNYEALEMEASYTTSPYVQKEIPQKYAKMIQYADFLVNVPTHIPIQKSYQGDWDVMNARTDISVIKTKKPHLYAFLNFVNDFPNRPTIDSCYKTKFDDVVYDKDFHYSKKREKCTLQYYQNLETWDSLRIEYVKHTLSKTDKFRVLFDEAIQETITTEISNPTIEFYIAELKSVELAFQLCYNRDQESYFVFDNFSTDFCDRAKEILQLAAAAGKWGIFIKHHLIVLNDNFEPECSHIKKGETKRTYTKELEEIGINTLDFLLGSCLRINNPSKKHHWLNSRAVSRALSELKDKDKVENTLLSMIEDQELDDFNRMIICLLFKNYNCLLKDSKREAQNQKRYFKALSTLPGTLGENLDKFDVPELGHWFN